VEGRELGRPESPSRRVVDQRVRNRVIEYFELAASFERQDECEKDVPIAHVPQEVINQWEDNFPGDLRTTRDLPPVYSPDEAEAILSFHGVWDSVAQALPDDYAALGAVQEMPEWNELCRAAASALDVFKRRGRMPEDREVP
jgi:hypothetical protein